MEKIMVFPLNLDSITMIANFKQLDQYELTAVSSYLEDRELLDNLQKTTKCFCSVDFEKCLKLVDSVVFVENNLEVLEKRCKEQIELVIKRGKKVYLNNLNRKIAEGISDKSKVQLIKGMELPKNIDLSYQEEIYCPVISVMGMGKSCDKFNLQIKVKTIIEKKGYKVLAICSNIFGEFLGMKYVPEFLLADNISLPIKVNMFKKWLKILEKKYDPDIILLSYPGGILKFSDYENNFYGEAAIVISEAVPIDDSILTLYRNLGINDDSINRLKTFCENKFNQSVDNFVISRQSFKLNYEQKEVEYYCNNDVKAHIDIKNTEAYVSLIEDDVMVEDMVIRILNRLQNNVEAI